mmetsp:Transcript_108606/g.184085  ORF Transcript_108606/g.184085 Transcript_108606/m.184085 type:complete len:122 (-) Transcript_108606:191-556(-)
MLYAHQMVQTATAKQLANKSEVAWEGASCCNLTMEVLHPTAIRPEGTEVSNHHHAHAPSPRKAFPSIILFIHSAILLNSAGNHGLSLLRCNLSLLGGSQAVQVARQCRIAPPAAAGASAAA